MEDDILAELKLAETELTELTLENPGETQPIAQKRIERLGNMIERLDKIIRRLRRVENRYPDEKARELIRKAYRYTSGAKDAFGKERYRQAYLHAKDARRCAREALQILKAKRNIG